MNISYSVIRYNTNVQRSLPHHLDPIFKLFQPNFKQKQSHVLNYVFLLLHQFANDELMVDSPSVEIKKFVCAVLFIACFLAAGGCY